MKLIRRSTATIFMLVWILPWIIAFATFIYGWVVVSFGDSERSTEFGAILLYIVFFCGLTLSISILSTLLFAVYLSASSKISAEERRFWIKRFTFSFVTAIPEFWYRHMWISSGE
ncbi:MAG: hypothetical protein KJ069_08295 [Anaerolineae bacterium]|nr:hypothetical protein [Anaerolineae bacterium]